jgi:hypothetical protein
MTDSTPQPPPAGEIKMQAWISKAELSFKLSVFAWLSPPLAGVGGWKIFIKALKIEC